jgi:arabinose-5-phosphate isomerase
MDRQEMKRLNKIGSDVIKQEMKGLQALSEKLGKTFDLAINVLADKRIIYFTGVGKSGHVAKKLAATMISLGNPAVFIHPTEAGHGDLGMVTPEDAVVVLSRSGNAGEAMDFIDYANDIGAATIIITENIFGRLAEHCDIKLEIPKVSEAWGHAPTTSTAMQMAYGDALAITLAELKGYKWEDFKKIHPAGNLNKAV